MPEEPPFEQADALPGLVYVPKSCGRKKHPCPDCFECQWCADSRCAGCRGRCKATQSSSEPMKPPTGSGSDEP